MRRNSERQRNLIFSRMQHSTTTYQLGVVLHPCDTQEQMEHVAGFFFSFPLFQGNEVPVSIPRIRRLWCRGGLRTRCEHEPCRVCSALDASNLCALVKITTVEVIRPLYRIMSASNQYPCIMNGCLDCSTISPLLRQIKKKIKRKACHTRTINKARTMGSWALSLSLSPSFALGWHADRQVNCSRGCE